MLSCDHLGYHGRPSSVPHAGPAAHEDLGALRSASLEGLGSYAKDAKVQASLPGVQGDRSFW